MLTPQVRLYNVNSQGQSEPKAMYQHEAPVLDLTWTKVGSKVLDAELMSERIPPHLGRM